MSKLWKWFLPGYVWALPMTLIGIVMCLIFRSHSWRWSNGCIECVAGKYPDGTTRIVGKPGAQTWGFLIVYAEPKYREIPWLRVHERVHVVQGLLGGPLFVLAYIACFYHNYYTNGRQYYEAYRHNPFEEWAYDRESRPGAWGTL